MSVKLCLLACLLVVLSVQNTLVKSQGYYTSTTYMDFLKRLRVKSFTPNYGNYWIDFVPQRTFITPKPQTDGFFLDCKNQNIVAKTWKLTPPAPGPVQHIGYNSFGAVIRLWKDGKLTHSLDS